MKINCHLCGKHVDRITMESDPLSNDTVITAYCHGAIDEMRLSQTDVIKMGREVLQQIGNGTGVAFQTTKEKAPDPADLDAGVGFLRAMKRVKGEYRLINTQSTAPTIILEMSWTEH
jgi:hypothetical protein